MNFYNGVFRALKDDGRQSIKQGKKIAEVLRELGKKYGNGENFEGLEELYKKYQKAKEDLRKKEMEIKEKETEIKEANKRTMAAKEEIARWKEKCEILRDAKNSGIREGIERADKAEKGTERSET